MKGEPKSAWTPDSGGLRWLLGTLAATAIAILVYHLFVDRTGWGGGMGGRRDNRSASLDAGPDAGYVDGASCRGCHQKIWETYRLTGMGRSFVRARPETIVEGFKTGGSLYHQTSDRHYKMYGNDGSYYVRRHQVGFDGKETNVVEKRVDFVIGSGNHVRTFLTRTPEGRIFELPVAWYSERGGYWAMNPGYDHANHYDFSREITHECLFCHNAYPEIAPGADRFGSEARFPGSIPEGIDCQRCHGPGRRHVDAVPSGRQEQIREAILNPARLSSERQLELCMQCHLETTSQRLPHSILRFDRGAFSYRPGEPLGDYALHFDHAPGTGYDDKFEIAHHAYRLRKSACFQQSAGRLTCTTCHDPHSVPRGAAAAEHYLAACRGCHGPALETHIAARKHPRAGNCIECHMPKRRTEDVVHVVMTDHQIQRRKPERDLVAALKERHDTEETAYRGPVVLYYPPRLPPTGESELYLAVAQVKQLTNLKDGVARLAAAIEKYRPMNGEFYFELAEAYAKVGLTRDALRQYEEATRRKPDFQPAWLGLGRTLSKSGQHARAIEVLERARERGAKSAALDNDMGLIHLRQQNVSQAVAVFRRSIEGDPSNAEAYNNLGGALTQTGDRSAAEEAYRAAIRIRPDFAEAHRNLANLLTPRGDLLQAEYHFRKAVYHNASYAAAHCDYGAALAGAERYDLARSQFESAVRLDPSMPEAHSGLADMLSLQGQTSRAIQHYAKALKLNPDMGGAHLGLGSALASQSRYAEAVSHLQKAAASTEAEVRLAAQEALQALRGQTVPR